MTVLVPDDPSEPIEYDALVSAFNQALLHTLRKHSIAASFLDFWVPDADPVLGILSMIDSARIAGHTEIAIKLSPTTVGPDAMGSLRNSVARLGHARFEQTADHTILRITGMSSDTDRSTEGQRHTDKKLAWSVGAGDSQPLKADVSWDGEKLPAFADAHAGLRSGLELASKSLTRDRLPGGQAAGLVRVVGTHGGCSLYLDVDPATHVVKSACHQGGSTPSERVALDQFCKLAENTPIQEVADHVGLRVIDELVDDDNAPPVAGILLPSNAGVPFQTGPIMARQAYDAFRAAHAPQETANFFVPAPSAEWLKLTTAEREDRVVAGIRAFLQSEQLYPDDLDLLRLEKSKSGHEVRVVIGFSDRIDVAAKPPLLRRLEQRLRRDAERQIDIVADRARDKSKLRRLS